MTAPIKSYGHVSDARIASLSHAISDGAAAIYFGVTVDRVRRVRADAAMRKRPDQPAGSTKPAIAPRPESAGSIQANASKRLLTAQLRTGQHFISDPELLAQRKRECGLK